MEMAFLGTDFDRQPDQNWIERGDAALRDGNPVEAAGWYGRALEADPFNAGAYTRLSTVYWAQGKTEDCLNALLKALELEPGDRDTILECGRVFAALGKEDFAKEMFEAYLDKNPQDGEIRSRLEALGRAPEQGPLSEAAEFFNRQGEMQFGRGNIAHATACFEMAIEENPLLGEAYNNLGVIEMGSGKIREALKNFLKALELKPEDGEILANSGRGLALLGQIDAAIDVYRKYLRLFPKDSSVWEEFEALLRQSAAPAWKPEGLSSGVADIYRHTAEQLLEAGDLNGAFEAAQKSLKIEPQSPGCLHVLASLHCAIGQRADARRVLEVALTIDPTHARCKEMLQALENEDGVVAG
ncbi:MAG: tetratricopeptide repeat protein [Syntrophobacteraceae bacterium]|nr:tetratricopeptide repeat protein [Syntrophobacteraceae bacterium]